MVLMAARQRKTMVVCKACHEDITYGRPMRRKETQTGFMHGEPEQAASGVVKRHCSTGEPDVKDPQQSLASNESKVWRAIPHFILFHR